MKNKLRLILGTLGVVLMLTLLMIFNIWVWIGPIEMLITKLLLSSIGVISLLLMIWFLFALDVDDLTEDTEDNNEL